jgi:hypothetical protein
MPPLPLRVRSPMAQPHRPALIMLYGLARGDIAERPWSDPEAMRPPSERLAPVLLRLTRDGAHLGVLELTLSADPLPVAEAAECRPSTVSPFCSLTEHSF